MTAYLQATSAASAAATSITLTLTVTAGDLLVVACGAFGSTPTFTVTDTHGNSYAALSSAAHFNNSTCQLFAAIAVNTGSLTATVTRTGASSGLTAVLAEYANPNSNVAETTATGTSGGFPIAAPNLTVSTGTHLLVYAAFNQSNANTFTVSQDIVIRRQQTNPDAEALVFAERIVTGSGTYGGEYLDSLTGSGGTAGLTAAAASLSANACSGGAGGGGTSNPNYGFVS